MSHFVCFIAGEDAVKFESLPDDVVVAKALSVLRSIFGDQTVPEVSATCTDNPSTCHGVPLSPAQGEPRDTLASRRLRPRLLFLCCCWVKWK